METPKYDADYFIKKFEAIPEEKWTDKGGYFDYDDSSKRCALGHCRGVIMVTKDVSIVGDDIAEANALGELFYPIGVADVNDGRHPRFQEPTPKQRILAALRELKGEGY